MLPQTSAGRSEIRFDCPDLVNEICDFHGINDLEVLEGQEA
jgi:hypothetical protein